MNSPSARQGPARAPERGSFPLDHGGTCKPQMIEFQKCMKQHKGGHAKCRSFSKTYLACRMDNELMARDDFKNLGVTKTAEEAALKVHRENGERNRKKENKGFVAGLTVRGEKLVGEET